MHKLEMGYDLVNKTCISTCEDDKPVLSVHVFVDSSIIPIDFPEDIVLSHVVRIHLCCWSLTADSHCLGWPGQAIQEDVDTAVCQEVESQKYQGHRDYNLSPIFIVPEFYLSLKFFAVSFKTSTLLIVIVLLALKYYQSH